MANGNSFLKCAIAFVLCSFYFFEVSAQGMTTEDSITVSIDPTYDDVSASHRFWLGENYRKLWATPVKLPVMYLSREKGGLTILQKGGGFQTKSLRLRDSTGQEWILRTIQKYPEKKMPEHLKKTVVKDILQDQVTTAHPYSSLTVPVFSVALDLPHANPQIVYIPNDASLGVYKEEFSNAVFLFEERQPLSESSYNTARTKSQLKKDNDNTIDQQLVLRARLMDMLLGDWDRHEDQWRWQKSTTKNETIYKPVPRDRDMVYYNTSGVFPWIVSHQWLMSKFQGFHDNIRDIKGFNFGARYFDRYFLNSLSENDWLQQAAYVQDHITDSVIDKALSLLPATIYQLSATTIRERLIARRKTLQKNAVAYYRFLAIHVDIPASDKHERFDINNTPEGNVNLNIYKIKKDGTTDKLIYNRLFIKGITKEIRLYGFAGKDIFSVTGNAKSNITIRMIGGNDKDSFYVAPDVHNRRSLYIYDQANESNSVPSKKYAKIRTSTDSLVNTFDDQAFKYDRVGPLVLANYNIDQGLLLKVGFLREKQGFRKDPYRSRQQFLANYATARKSFIFEYAGDFKNKIAGADIGVNIVAKGPHNLGNFFGIGNETTFINKGDNKIGYYRSRYDVINTDIFLRKKISTYASLYGGVETQYYTASQQNNTTRFLDAFNSRFPEQRVYQNSFYTGLIGGLVVDSRNDSILPAKGVFLQTRFSAIQQLNDVKRSYGILFSAFSWYLATGKKATVVFANRIGLGTTVGNPAFFQLLSIGGAQSMRGFHTNRFAGKTIFYHNLEMRLKLFDFNTYILPGTLGLIGFNDIGRVWATGERSNQWHNAYGGGIYLIPARLILIQAVVGFSKEGRLPYITIGFRF